MATNYTTKTAALKATLADIRKLTARQVFVDHTVEGTTEVQSSNVVDLINNAGLRVGSDLNGDYTAETIVKTNKVNFLGTYVNVVTDEQSGNTNVYIGENTNAPGYSLITDTLDAANIVYASSESAYVLPSDASADSSYARTSKLTDTETVDLNGGAVIGNILKTSTIKVTVTSDKGNTVYETPVLFSQATTTATSKTWPEEPGAIKVDATSFKRYTTDDAKYGKTPDSVTGVFKVTLDNDKLVGENGGWYSVSVALGGTTKSTNKVFVWKTATTSPSVGTPEIAYSNGGSTRQVSGITYDASGSFTLTVPTIKNTQQWVTKDTNRLELTDNVGDVDFSGTITTSDLTVESGTSTNETAVYKYTTTKSANASVKKVSAGISAQAYGQTGTVAGNVSSKTYTAESWLWTTTTADTALVANFHTEDHGTYGRKKNTLDDITGNASVVAYDSTASLADDYPDQLLVQGGQLKYPNDDVTGKYSGLKEEKRYYVRPLVFSGSNQISKITVKVGSGMASNFNNGTTRLYLVKKGTSTVQVLNYYKELSEQDYGVGIADSAAPSSGSWGCTINAQGAWALYGSGHTSAGKYYLVVEMTEDADPIGSITISQ